MPKGNCEEAGGAGRRPCCRRRGGGGGALVEPAALAALLSAGGYGYDLRRIILERTGGELDVDVGGMYRSLRRLEEEGAVVSRWSEEEAGPRRREYQVTSQGVELAQQWLEALRQRQHLDELLVGLLEGCLADASLAVSGASEAPDAHGTVGAADVSGDGADAPDASSALDEARERLAAE